MSNMWKVVSTTAIVLLLGAAVTVNAQEAVPKPERQVADLNITDQDYAIGSENAPVVIVEYASLTCPSCRQFHGDVLPTIKTEYVDTNRVRIVYRDFPLDRLALAAAMLARCNARERFFSFIELLYDQQESWSSSPDPVAALRTLFSLGGMGNEAFNACFNNREVQEQILAQRIEAAQKFGVDGTPTVFVNGGDYGNPGLPLLRKILDSLLTN